jgi:hypothetical protein
MAKKKPRPDNTPRRKRFKRAQRLASAPQWLPTYTGKDIVKGYRKHYGVDWQTAFTELEMLGVAIDPARKEQTLQTVQQQAELRRQKKQERLAEQEAAALGWDQDDTFAVIIGYTSGGAPYGLTWEEWEALEGSEDFDG